MRRLVALALAALAAGCSGEAAEEAAPAEVRRTPVTVASPVRRDLEVVERSVGTLEPKHAPWVAAEVAGRIAEAAAEEGDAVAAGAVLARIDETDLRLALDAAVADEARIAALIRAQEKQVARLRSLLPQGHVNQSLVDEAEAQLDALREQLTAARARVAERRHALAKAAIRAPVAGRIEARRVSAGDFVQVGQPLFRIVDEGRLRAVAPLPEALAPSLRPGLEVRLASPTAPGRTVRARIDEIRPMVSRSARALYVIAELDNPGGWRAGASVDMTVVLARRAGAVTVPAPAVVRRPAGEVVYVLADGGRVAARPVETGLHGDGWIEIRSGLAGDERVVVDGAGFLTDGAAVAVRGEPGA
ncbi:efflux RND transporter periplasmic adaptor subunit [Inmirania thermothiophila]|uniref:RND family efflux transporter MFP subunit n=1 Tax=Inmirania thermothiophila TaxID=1750597 RepID=A0A3N1Y0S3_9GAMM|nr:efflux RND transporter periplasmic adaptor subunit [Inmirania thermothiophila]ROR32400.1 RND family efflux transporter MFP subunit [Inmirania thermothiophila]